MLEKIDSYNMYLFMEGKLEKAYDLFGCHVNKNDKGEIIGATFRVFAPNASIVSVIGEFNNWDSRINPMVKIDDRGVFETTVNGIKEYDQYRYVILTKDNGTLYKSDPYGFYSDFRPGTCSRVYDIDGFNWSDKKYLELRNKMDIMSSPLSIYEMNIGSWIIKPDGTFNRYNELPEYLIPYLKKMGFNAVEFMPLIEFPLDESWGYQGIGYFSTTSRYGSPKDLMYLIDCLHKENIKVIMDFVPGHISKDSHGMYDFDGSHLYEYTDELRRENVIWGTANIDFSKGHSSSLFLSSAMFYLDYFHIDGFRLDAVSNIFYYLGNSDLGENKEGINFLRNLSNMIKTYDKGIIISAEDSTVFKDVTKSTKDNGIGFDFKWNMGWMNDTLSYFSKDPIYRKYHHNNLTFSMTYQYSENFLLPLSHDEVVHGKCSLIEKMPGDYWQKFANYRVLIGYQFTHPGKKLLFMGSEFAQFKEWNEKEELDWFLLQYEKHKKAQNFVVMMNKLYLKHPALYELDNNPDGFKWIDCDNSEQSVYSFYRYGGGETLIVVMNLTPNSYSSYRVGVPYSGKYTELINSDKEEYGGSNLYNGLPIESEKIPKHGFNQSIDMVVAPLSISIFKILKEE